MTEEMIKNKCLGILIGGAVGDAFGYPVEFVNSFHGISAKYGDNGIIEYDMSYTWLDSCFRNHKALLSDDTQMTLYTTEGIIETTKNCRPLMTTICNLKCAP